MEDARAVKNCCHVLEDNLTPGCFAKSLSLNDGYALRLLRSFLLVFFSEDLRCFKNRVGLESVYYL